MSARVYQGSVPNPVIKKGNKGNNVKYLQSFLNWYGKYGLIIDGKCGRKTIDALKKFQKKEKLTVDGIYGIKSYAKVKVYIQAKRKYTGTFPSLNNNQKIINGLAYRMCHPYGTPPNKYTYEKGKPVKAYKDGIDKVFPNHNKWSNKKQKVGACCDILTAVELGMVKIKVKKDLKDQLIEMPKMKQLKANGIYKDKDFKGGMIVQRGRKDYSGHTYTICELVNGERYIANAHYKHLHGTYAVMDSKVKTEKPRKWKYYQCYTPLGAIRTDYRLNDYGYDVLYIQRFLKWYGFAITPDGDFGKKTENAVKVFQEKEKLKIDGIIGQKTIDKMKIIKK